MKKSLLELFGPDSYNFLQRIITNDLKSQKAIYSLILNPKGQYLFDIFIITKTLDKYLILINSNLAEEFLQYIIKARFRSKFEIKDISSLYQIFYEKKYNKDNNVTSFKDPRLNSLGYWSLYKDFNDLNNLNNLIDISKNNNLDDKYNYSIPEGISELISNKSFPMEYGLHLLNSISFNKGCYVGQESVSRIKHFGHLRKQLFQIKFASTDKKYSQGEHITCNNEKIGFLCSHYKNIGMGIINTDKLKDDKSIYLLNNSAINIFYPKWSSKI